jgi:P27 family predicted phage terminase small subunit
MATAGRKTLPESLRSPPRNPAEAKARAARDAAAPKYDPADLDLPPALLAEEAAAIWTELAPVLKGKGIITEADITCFTTICETLADIRAYQAAIKLEGYTMEGAKGVIVKHPLIAPLITLRGLLRSYLCEIGWTPGSRTKVASQSGVGEGDDQDPLTALLTGGGN